MIYDMKADCSDVCFIVRISLSHTLIFFLQEYWSKEVSMLSLKSLWLHKFLILIRGLVFPSFELSQEV